MDWGQALAFMADLVSVAKIVNRNRVNNHNSALWPADAARGPGVELSRLPPEQHPVLPELTVSGVELVEGVGFPSSNPGVDVVFFRQNTPAANPIVLPGGVEGGEILPRPQGKAKVRITYRRQPYVTQVRDSQLPGAAVGYEPMEELTRFTTRVFRPNVQATQIGGGVFRFERLAGDPGPTVPGPGALPAPIPLGNESPAKMLPFGEVRYTIHQLPLPGVTPGAVTTTGPAGSTLPALLGRLNNEPFDFQGISPIVSPFPVGTLLFLGAETSEPYWQLGADYPYIDLTLVFGYQPGTWVKIYRRGVGFRLVTTTGLSVDLPVNDDVCPYNFGDFARLLQVEQPSAGPTGVLF